MSAEMKGEGTVVDMNRAQEEPLALLLEGQGIASEPAPPLTLRARNTPLPSFQIELPLPSLFGAPTPAEPMKRVMKREKAPGHVAAIARLRRQVNEMSVPDMLHAKKQHKLGGE